MIPALLTQTNKYRRAAAVTSGRIAGRTKGKLGARAGVDAVLAAFAPTSGGKAGCNATAFAGKFIESPARTRSYRYPDDDRSSPAGVGSFNLDTSAARSFHTEGLAQFGERAFGHRHERSQDAAELQSLGSGLEHFEPIKGLQQGAPDD